MKPKNRGNDKDSDLVHPKLVSFIDKRHEWVQLAHKIDWNRWDKYIASLYSDVGRPGCNVRLLTGLHLLKYSFKLSDEEVCERWVENPYFQYFCGEKHFCYELPIDRSSMSKFRKRVGEEFLEEILADSLNVAINAGALKEKHLRRVVVDTTVQPKAIAFPLDVRLMYKAMISLGKLARKHGLKLRQSYVRKGKEALISYGRYRHAKQFRRAKRAKRYIKHRLGRVIRDISRGLNKQTDLTEYFKEALVIAKKIYDSPKAGKDKCYSFHAPEVECIGKGKVHKQYEFGCKVSIMTHVNPAKGGHFVLHAKALPGNPYDGHTLAPVLEEYSIQSGVIPERIYVDKGYKGHEYPYKHKVFKSGQKRGVTKLIKRELRRRSVVEPVIGHMKSDGLLQRNYLKGKLGDKLNVLLCAIGHNFRLLLRFLKKKRFFIFLFLQDNKHSVLTTRFFYLSLGFSHSTIYRDVH